MRRAAALVVALLGCRYDANATPLITAQHAIVVPGAGLGPGAFYVTLSNAGGADTLVGIAIASAASAMLHETVDSGGRMAMRHVERVPVPARGTLALTRGAAHGMITGLDSALARGDSIPVSLHLSRSGQVTVRAVVLDFADLDSALAPPARR